MSDYVPGEFQCPQCGFSLTKSFINTDAAIVGRDSRDVMEPCPNDGSILRPVKWADALDEARGQVWKFVKEGRNLKLALRTTLRLLLDSYPNTPELTKNIQKIAERSGLEWPLRREIIPPEGG